MQTIEHGGANMDIGDRVGSLEIIGEIVTNGKRCYSPVRCVCGKEFLARRDAMKIGELKSCGCLKNKKFFSKECREAMSARAVAIHTKHGNSTRKVRSSEYNAWASMIQRCTNPNSEAYEWYGARGIGVCDKWIGSFEAFLEDMGKKPPKTSIERIDNSKGYEPGNCKWATRREQMRNTRQTRFVDYNGQRLCVRDAAAAAGISEHRVYWRIHKHKMDAQTAFEQCLKR
jgi:hypothetical protein